ncbi:MAG TPA: YdcF family protein [Candidatus Paceibacterota bacterium]|nr:YdcF family protein [Candidatus Paceibacterota bacterium]
MNQEEALQTIWDYMHLHHQLKKADAIFVLGNHDLRVAEYAAKLWLDGWAPYLICAGSGTIHANNPAWSDFAGKTEAELFANVARKAGVPDSAILIENQSQNTGQNYEFTDKLLKDRGVDLQTVIAVQKPYMERRTYAAGKVWWPDKEIIVTSPPLTLAEYPNESTNANEHWIHSIVGDLQRIREYPKKGFQIEQEIPENVWAAYEFLVAKGYTRYLIKD